jgi:GNAT superfamily N-acetyltransferase
MSSLYAEYVKEREEAETLEHGYGFITFRVFGESVLLKDFFVRRENRKQGLSHKIWNEFVEKMKERGIKKVVGNVDVRSANGTEILRNHLFRGCKLVQAMNDIITVEKEI